MDEIDPFLIKIWSGEGGEGPHRFDHFFFFIEKPGIHWKYNGFDNLSMKIPGTVKNNGLGISYMKICGKRWNSHVFYAFSIQKHWNPLNSNVFCISGNGEHVASLPFLFNCDQFIIKNGSISSMWHPFHFLVNCDQILIKN